MQLFEETSYVETLLQSPHLKWEADKGEPGPQFLQVHRPRGALGEGPGTPTPEYWQMGRRPTPGTAPCAQDAAQARAQLCPPGRKKLLEPVQQQETRLWGTSYPFPAPHSPTSHAPYDP